MNQCIAVSVFALASILLASCNPRRDANDAPEANAEPKRNPDTNAENLDDDPPSLPLAEGTAKISYDITKDAYVTVEFWEHGQPSARFEREAQRLISPGGEVAIAVRRRDRDGKSTYIIEIGDGLGKNLHCFELPPDLNHFVSRLPKEIAVENGAAVAFCYLCVGKECELRKNESVEDLARRVEYAFVLSLGEAEKK